MSLPRLARGFFRGKHGTVHRSELGECAVAKSMKTKVVVSSIKDDERWRVESDLNTLIEAEKIEADPKRWAKVQALAKEKMMDVAKIASESD